MPEWPQPWAPTRPPRPWWALSALALGNVAERLRFGAVKDFLDVYVRCWHWPAFNFAGVAMVSGVGLLLLSEFLASRRFRRLKG